MLSFKFEPLHTFILEAKTYDPQLDTVIAILTDVCDAMHEQRAVRFAVSGFGDDQWAVDVRTDMLLFFEQLPSALGCIERRKQFAIDFYEQGLERYLNFAPDGDEYLVKCSSLTEWQPAMPTEVVDSTHLATMLRRALTDFEASLAQSAPQLATHPWIREWSAATVAL